MTNANEKALDCSNEKPQVFETNALKKPTKKNINKIALLVSFIYANFWGSCCISLQAPFFPKEAEMKGATPTEYGLVFGIFELVVMIMSPIFGKLIPKVSPRFLCIFGVVIEGIACALFGLLDSIPGGRMYIAMAFVVRIFEGLGAAALVIATFTLIAIEFPENVATSLAILETAFGLGIMVGPIVGGALFELGGFRLPFIVCGVILLMGAAVFFLLIPATEESEPMPPRDFKAFIAHGGTLVYLLSIITSLLLIGFNAATLEPHLRQFKLSPVIVGAIFISLGGVYALTTPIFGYILDKGVRSFYVATLGHLLVCIGLLFLGPVVFLQMKLTLSLVIITLACIGLGLSAKLVSAFSGILRGTISRGFPDNLATYSMVSALFATACSTGAFIGPSIGGYMLDRMGYRMAITVIFGSELSFFAIILLYHGIEFCARKARSPEKSPLILKEMKQISY